MSKPFNASDPDTTTLTINCEPTVAKKVSGDPGQVVDELVRQTVPVAACALSTTAGNIGSIERSSNGITNSSFGFFNLVYTDFLLEV